MNTNTLFIYLYMFIGLAPYLGAADKVSVQNLYLSILNVSALVFIYTKFKSDFVNQITKQILKLPVFMLFLFLLWSSVTSLFAVNFAESLKIINEIFNQLVAFIILIHLISQIKNYERLLFYLISILLLTDLVSIYYPYLNDIYESGKPVFRSMKYRGLTGNINIMSYSIILKLPFLYYFILNNTKPQKLIFLLVAALYALLSILETRSAILAFLLITGLTILYFLIFQKKKYDIKQVSKKILLPLLIAFFLSNFSSEYFNKDNIQSRVSSLTNFSDDQSSQQRFRYYMGAIESIKNNPIVGIGIGNWEIESIQYEKNFMKSYIVPYHAHNDYLEIMAETGIPGFILYFGFIFVIVLKLVKKVFYHHEEKKDKTIYFLILMGISSYLIDALFNFPFARTLSQINLIFLLALAINLIDFNEIRIFKFSKIISLTIFLLLPISIYSSTRLFISSTHQALLLRQFNGQDFSYPPIDFVDKLEMEYTSLAATTIPMYTFKGIYYAEQERYREAIEYFRKGAKYNPYLFINESYMGRSFYYLKELDSARYYTEKAFYNLPNNLPHYANYLQVIKDQGDSIAIKKAYEYVPIKDFRGLHEELYLLAMSDVVDPGQNNFVLENLNVNLESGTDQLKKGYYSVKIGTEKMYEADINYQIGVDYFERKDFINALSYFKKATELNPLELPYKENVANTLMQLGRDSEALIVLNELINDNKTKSLKAYFLRALTLYGMDDIESACYDLKYLNDVKYLGDNNLYDVLCNAKK